MRASATAEDVENVLGDVDGFVVKRVLDTGATLDEIAEALADIEVERELGERRVPTSARVAEVREILEELSEEDDDGGYAS